MLTGLRAKVARAVYGAEHHVPRLRDDRPDGPDPRYACPAITLSSSIVSLTRCSPGRRVRHRLRGREHDATRRSAESSREGGNDGLPELLPRVPSACSPFLSFSRLSACLGVRPLTLLPRPSFPDLPLHLRLRAHRAAAVAQVLHQRADAAHVGLLAVQTAHLRRDAREDVRGRHGREDDRRGAVAGHRREGAAEEVWRRGRGFLSA